MENGKSETSAASPLQKLVMPKYKSAIYFGVIIRGEAFKGWTAPDVGDGRMRFTHPKHGELRINKGLSSKWMQECWDDFMDAVARFEA